MWTRIINYENFVRYGVQLGAKVSDSEHHKLDFLILGQRKNRYIFRLDKMLLSYFFNKKLITDISSKGANFLFLTSRSEYYDIIRSGADTCSQVALLWRPAALGNLNIRGEALEELYDRNTNDKIYSEVHPVPDVFVLFDNEKFRSKRLIGETDQFMGVPLFSVMDTDSIVRRAMFPIIGNDDSSMSVYFYSLFMVYSVISGKRVLNDFNVNDEKNH